MLLLNLIQVMESISGSVVPLAMFVDDIWVRATKRTWSRFLFVVGNSTIRPTWQNFAHDVNWTWELKDRKDCKTALTGPHWKKGCLNISCLGFSKDCHWSNIKKTILRIWGSTRWWILNYQPSETAHLAPWSTIPFACSTRQCWTSRAGPQMGWWSLVSNWV